MKPEVEAILKRVKDTADFGFLDFTDINTTNALGENALHCVIVWGDYEAAQTLIKNGIDIQKHGEQGYTPLHVACQFGRKDIVELLLKHGADLFARTEGDLPFTVARLHSQDDICEMLNSYHEGKSTPSLDARNLHMQQLNNSIETLEQQVAECEKNTPNQSC